MLDEVTSLSVLSISFCGIIWTFYFYCQFLHKISWMVTDVWGQIFILNFIAQRITYQRMNLFDDFSMFDRKTLFVTIDLLCLHWHDNCNNLTMSLKILLRSFTWSISWLKFSRFLLASYFSFYLNSLVISCFFICKFGFKIILHTSIC